MQSYPRPPEKAPASSLAAHCPTHAHTLRAHQPPLRTRAKLTRVAPAPALAAFLKSRLGARSGGRPTRRNQRSSCPRADASLDTMSVWRSPSDAGNVEGRSAALAATSAQPPRTPPTCYSYAPSPTPYPMHVPLGVIHWCIKRRRQVQDASLGALCPLPPSVTSAVKLGRWRSRITLMSLGTYGRSFAASRNRDTSRLIYADSPCLAISSRASKLLEG